MRSAEDVDVAVFKCIINALEKCLGKCLFGSFLYLVFLERFEWTTLFPLGLMIFLGLREIISVI